METTPMQAKEQPKGNSRKILLAILSLIAFVAGVIIFRKLADYGITTYLPAYSGYIIYVNELAGAVLGLLGVYVIYKILLSMVNVQERRRRNTDSAEVAKLLLRILFYVAILLVVLLDFGPSLGISLSQALAGSAIGGVVIGLAVQTVANSILSGFLVSSSKTMPVGEVMVMHSGLWGDIVGKVMGTNILFTDIMTQNGNYVKLPNTVLFNSTTFTRIRDGDSFCYSFPVALNADVPAEKLEGKVIANLKSEFLKLTKQPPKIYLASKTAGVNTFTVIVCFENFSEINAYIGLINKSFDKAYWELKAPPTPPPKLKASRKAV